MSKILRILDATMKLDDMSLASPTSENSPTFSANERPEKQMGGLYPLIMINKYVFSTNEIVSFSLDETDFMPRATINIVSGDGVFLSTAYPKDGDPVSIFIRSKMNEFHPIRMDFIIDNIISSTSPTADGNAAAYTLQCTMRVTDMFTDYFRAYKDSTSFDAIKEVARAAGLGFASNETTTNDRQTWIQPGDTTEDFVKNVESAAYMNDNSFFRIFIDKYYIMNMVNVNAQLTNQANIEEALMGLERANDYMRNGEVTKEKTSLILSNMNGLRGTTMFITGYTLTSNMGEVLEMNGYRRYAQYYEQFINKEDRYQSQMVEPLTTEGTTNEMLLMRGRESEQDLYEKWNKYKWLGRQQSLPKGNVHQSYKYAIIQNIQNSLEIDKYELRTQIGQANFNLYRGMQVPIVITTEGKNQRSAATRLPEQDESMSFTYDKFLSGFYYVKGIKIYWSQYEPQFRQELILTRREWPKPTTMVRGDDTPENVQQ